MPLRIAAHLRHVRHYLYIVQQADQHYQQLAQTTGLMLFDREREQIDAAWAWLGQHLSLPGSETLFLEFTTATVSVGDLRYDKRRERIPQLHLATEIAQRTGNTHVQAITLGNLGVAYYALGETKQAIVYHQQALELAERIGSKSIASIAIGSLGSAYLDLGDLERAISYHELARKSFRELGDKNNEVVAQNALANCYLYRSEFQRAIKLYNESLAICRADGNKRLEALSLHYLGIAYATFLHEPNKAKPLFQQSMRIYRDLGDNVGVAFSLSALGMVTRVLGDTHHAIQLYEEALATIRTYQVRHEEGKLLGNLANAYHDIGDERTALAYYLQDLAIARELGHPITVATTLANLGDSYRILGELDQAVTCLKEVGLC